MLCCVSTLLLFSCKKLNLDKIAQGEWNPNLALPLAHSTFDVYDILAHTDSSDLIVSDPTTGLLSLIYKTELEAIKGKDLLPITNLQKNYTYSVSDLGGTSVPAFNNSINYSTSSEISFPIDAGTTLKEIKLDGGNLIGNISSTIQHPITIQMDIPALKLNGVSFQKDIQLDASTGTSSIQMNESLAGYMEEFSTGSPNNTFEINFQIEVNGNGNAIDASDALEMDFSFENLSFDYVKGYFSPQTIVLDKDSIFLKLFEFPNDGYFKLTDPKINFSVVNSFGLPTRLNINQISTLNLNSGSVYPLLTSPKIVDLDYPQVMGDSAVTTFEFTKDNTTNIDEVLAPSPQYLEIESNIGINPDDQVNYNQFINEDSEIKIYAELDLPLIGFAHSFSFRDTIDFTSPTEDASMITSAMFRFIIDNGFPVDILGKFKFMDENYQELFVLGGTGDFVIASGMINNEGEVISKTKKVNDLTLTQEQIQLLNQVKFIEIYAEANTTDAVNQTVVKFLDYYSLDFQLSTQIKTKLNF